MDNKQKFLEQFKFELEQQNFQSPVIFSDAFGFSTTKERKQNSYNFVSIYRFYIKEENLNNEIDLKPIVVSVAYGERLDDGSVRLSPTSIKRKITWPLDLISTDEFFYNFVENKFFYKNKEITVANILKKVEFFHTKSTKLLQGSLLLVRLFFWRIIVVVFLKLLYYSFIKILYLISGIKTKESIWLVTLRRDRIDTESKVEKESFANEKIDIFGYMASAWSVVVYAILHLIIYASWFFCFDYQNSFIKSLFSNGFLTIIYVIPTLVFFERLIPRSLQFLIKRIGTMFHTVSFRQVKI